MACPTGAILELELWYDDLRTFSGNLVSLSRHGEKDAVEAQREEQRDIEGTDYVNGAKWSHLFAPSAWCPGE